MSLYWCHECGVRVETRVDDETEEVCCLSCGGNFVEEIESDDPPESFAVAHQEPAQISTHVEEPSLEAPVAREILASGSSTGSGSGFAPAGPGSSLDDSELLQQIPPRLNITQLGVNESSRRAVASRHEVSADSGHVENSVPGPEVLPLDGLLRNLLGGRGSEAPSRMTTTTATFSSGSGLPMQVFFNDGDAGGGDLTNLFNALGGVFGAPIHGNLGDYAFGNINNIINQLMQNDPNRHGAPPASKEVVQNLPIIKISETEIKANTECAVCKDMFALDEEAKLLPCTHPFHPDCILPWLKQHNSCPVCRHELPTDDEEYELRRRQLEQEQQAAAS